MRVFAFPGQSSCDGDGLRRALRVFPDGRSVLNRGSELLGRDLAARYAGPDGARIESNRDVQLCVFLTNHLYLSALERADADSDLSLGLSLGEYNHLVHIGALSFEAALALVDRRGALYDEGPDGIMAAVGPIDLEELLAVIEAHRGDGVVEVSNQNSPSQHVVGGERVAVERVLAVLEEDCFVLPVRIEDRIAMHTSLFSGVAERFRAALEAAPFVVPRRPYFPNVLGRIVEAPAKSELVEHLVAHVHRPVLFRQSVEHLLDRSPEVLFVEIGPRRVLTNLIRRGFPAAEVLAVDAGEDPLASFETAVERLSSFARAS